MGNWINEWDVHLLYMTGTDGRGGGALGGGDPVCSRQCQQRRSVWT